jgi:ribosomal protein S18 acetylase RimI-like enzyme
MNIRPAEPSDAEAVGRLAAEFQQYLKDLGDTTDFTFGSTEYLRDGFGETPAFAGLVVDAEEGVVAYALYHDGYDTDHGERVIHLVDLYVQASWRGRGAGAALMRQLSDVGRARGARSVIWSVYRHNLAAARFYERIGAAYLEDLHWMVLRLGEQ